MSTIKVSNIQHASAASAAITLDANGQATLNGLAYPTSGSLSGRNRIINGDMRIDQRNAGASVSTTGGFPVDRWLQYFSGGGVYSAQRSTTAPAGFANSLALTVTTADASIGAADYYMIRHKIEGYNIDDLEWGTADARTVTLSFWVRSSVTGTYGGSITNGGELRGYAFNYSISAANTWEYKTITIAGDTTGTWLTDNSSGLALNLSLGMGSTYSATAGSWLSASSVNSATGATNWISTNGATFYITGVQLEAGSVATPFERRSYGQELALCERYYQVYGGIFGFICHNNGTSNAYGGMPLRVKMRANPTADYIAPYNGGNVIYYSAGSSRTLTGLGLNIGRPDYAQLVVSGAGTLGTSGNAGHLDINDSRALSLTAEL